MTPNGFALCVVAGVCGLGFAGCAWASREPMYSFGFAVMSICFFLVAWGEQ